MKTLLCFTFLISSSLFGGQEHKEYTLQLLPGAGEVKVSDVFVQKSKILKGVVEYLGEGDDPIPVNDCDGFSIDHLQKMMEKDDKGIKRSLGSFSVQGLLRLWRTQDYLNCTGLKGTLSPFIIGRITQQLLDGKFKEEEKEEIEGHREFNRAVVKELHNRASYNDVRRLESIHLLSVSSVAFNRDGTQLASCSHDGTIITWNPCTDKPIMEYGRYSDLSKNVVVFSPDGQYLVSGGLKGMIGVYEMCKGGYKKEFKAHDRSITALAFNPHGTQLASGSDDKTIKIWNATTWSCLRTLAGHLGIVWSVAFNRKGTQFVSSSHDTTIKIWDTDTYECTKTLAGHLEAVSSVLFSPDGLSLASASADSTVKVWDSNTGDCIRTLKGHKGYVNSVAFNYDGTQLASGSTGDGTVRLWNPFTGKCCNTLKQENDVKDLSVYSVAFDPDGTQLASGLNDTTVRLWRNNFGRLGIGSKAVGALALREALHIFKTGERLKELECAQK